MSIGEMLSQSGILTLLGMGVVFAFLIIMILCMTLLHAVIHALKLDKEPEAKKSASAAPIQPAQDNGAVVAAIAAAVHDKALNS